MKEYNKSNAYKIKKIHLFDDQKKKRIRMQCLDLVYIYRNLFCYYLLCYLYRKCAFGRSS